MNLFSLQATVGLDTTTFDQDTQTVTETGEAFGAAMDDALAPSPDLTDFSSSFAAVMDDAQTKVSSVSTAFEDVNEQSELAKSVVDGFAEGVSEIIQKSIEYLVNFAGESIEIAAQSGTALADAFNAAQAKLELNKQALQGKVGETLLPIATGFTELLNSLSGVTALERFEATLAAIQTYEFTNIQTLKNDLAGIFGSFETVSPAEVGNITEMADGLSTQAAYWEDYATTLENLKKKNISSDFLAKIADGTVESLEKLKAIETADASELETLMTAYEDLQETQEAAATAISQVNLDVSEEMDMLVSNLAIAVSEMDQSAAATANSEATMTALISVLSRQYPEVESWVDKINSKLSTLGDVVLDNPNNPYGNNYHGSGSYARGLYYVPENDFVARLHAGEAVLTASQADEWRAEQAGSVSASGKQVTVNQYIDAVPQTPSEIAFETANALRMLRFNV